MSTSAANSQPNRRAVLLGVAGVVVGAGIVSGVTTVSAGAAARASRGGRGLSGADQMQAAAEAEAAARNAAMSAAAHRAAAHPTVPHTTVPHTSAAHPTSAAHHAQQATSPRTHVSTSVPKWARRWSAPIYDLDDFLKRDSSVHFAKRSVMLTVDDGPSPEWTPKYLRLFEKHHIKVTFNMIGEQVKPNRHIVKAVASEGHVIANHTWTHDEALPSGTAEHIHSEIHRTNEAIHDLTGYTPSTFRAPGGVWGPAVFAELARQRMMPLGWDIDPRDWALPGTSAIESAMLQAGRGDIILCHDGGGDRSETYAALKTVIPALLHRGLTFATLPAKRPGPVRGQR